ncbi:Major facilitator superfamily domain, general substrate transporter [Cordyceps fumosorosea ARSEF 2679]|uniref:Major facilitator superfamily domain, general substrate transporter n=1 Tax=Cordyceps fumosorosea (strain ARSEF 2679) TaxID=1081104 RepID=A0A167PAQ6_CORFA|nr:Major facilitator superfamily domain, general substrate transporter [Cordyceps fumosorosea ARSEF 2679]OAA56467.1 Major facilitator superfamily domain, general substrate transporter [Cordyceps fumosorosea ARSEF 2679]
MDKVESTSKSDTWVHQEMQLRPEDGLEQQVSDDSSQDRTPKFSDVRFIMVLAGFGMAFVGSQAHPLLFAAILPLVAADLHAPAQLIWFLVAQVIAIGVAAPFAGPLADLFDRKHITLFAVLLGMVGAVLLAATPNAAGFIAGQALSGIGIAVQELMAIAAVAEIVPTSQRGYYVALVVSFFVPFAPASLYGALIAQASSWRYCACAVAVWNAATAAILFFCYSRPPRVQLDGKRLTAAEKLRRVDWLGGVILTAGLLVLLVGINSGQQYAWNSARIIALLTIGIALLLAYVGYEYVLAPHPMFPGRLLRHPRAFVALMVVILMAGINYIPLLFFWVLECVAVYDSDIRQTGIRTMPFGWCILGGAIISALLVSMFRSRVQLIMTGFCIVQVVAIACMAVIDPHNLATAWAPLSLGLTAVGGVLIPNQLIATIITPQDLIGTATCLTVCIRAVGQVIGVSIFYQQFVQQLTKRTMQYVVPAAVQVGVYDLDTLTNMMPTLVSIPFSEYIKSLPQVNTTEKITMLHDATLVAFSGAFSRVYYVSIAFGAIAVIASCFIGDLSALIGNQVAVSYF